MLNFNKPGGNSMDNTIIDIVTIQRILHDPEPRDTSGKFDVQLVIDYFVDSKGWQRKMWLRGAYKRNQMGVIEGPGSMFRIANLFLACGYTIDQVNRMDETGVDVFFQGCVNKKVTILSYKNNKDKWSTSDNVGSVNDGQLLHDKFIKQWTQKGFPKNFIGPDGSNAPANPADAYVDPNSEFGMDGPWDNAQPTAQAPQQTIPPNTATQLSPPVVPPPPQTDNMLHVAMPDPNAQPGGGQVPTPPPVQVPASPVQTPAPVAPRPPVQAPAPTAPVGGPVQNPFQGQRV